MALSPASSGSRSTSPSSLHLLLCSWQPSRSWCAVGRHRGCAQGTHGCARGHRHDHAQQHRDLPGRVPAASLDAFQRPGQRQPGDPAHPRQRRSCRSCWGSGSACTPASWSPSPPRVHLVAHGALDHRLPVPRGRLQPARGAHRGVASRAPSCGSCSRRWARRSRRLGAGARHGTRVQRGGRRELRVRRHHGRAARSLQAAGHGARGHPVRRLQAGGSVMQAAGTSRSTSCSSCSPSSSCSSRRRRWSGRCSGSRQPGPRAPEAASSPRGGQRMSALARRPAPSGSPALRWVPVVSAPIPGVVGVVTGGVRAAARRPRAGTCGSGLDARGLHPVHAVRGAVEADREDPRRCSRTRARSFCVASGRTVGEVGAWHRSPTGPHGRVPVVGRRGQRPLACR